MKHLFYIVCICLGSAVNSVAQDYYFVKLTDKANSLYSLANPSAFLSTRAIARRVAHNCAIDSMDLPINSSYISMIQSVGVSIYHCSKWFNAVTVVVQNPVQLNALLALPCVASVELTWSKPSAGFISRISYRKSILQAAENSYGATLTQTTMLSLQNLHNLGFRGRDMVVAIMDVGFQNVDQITAFDSLRLSGRLLGTHDFVMPGGSVFDQGTHGTMVLSTMAGNLPNQFLGTAPDASYWLFRTEDEEYESRLEIDNWVAALEQADSAGVDVVNTSLGYTEFDDSSQNFTYADLNGRTARNSLAAVYAARRGMLLVNSAGNEGDDSWHYISTPADADSVLTVGSVSANRLISTFSSFGPTADNRIKPDICAMGTNSALINVFGQIAYASGTSFSGPIMAGAATSLWQALPTQTNVALMELIKSHADRYTSPDNQYGFGIPDVWASFNSVVSNHEVMSRNEPIRYYPNPVSNVLFIETTDFNQCHQIFSISDICGRQVFVTTSIPQQVDMTHFEPGIYIVTISGDFFRMTRKIIKQ